MDIALFKIDVSFKLFKKNAGVEDTGPHLPQFWRSGGLHCGFPEEAVNSFCRRLASNEEVLMLPSISAAHDLIRSAMATGRRARGTTIALAVWFCTLVCAESPGPAISAEPLSMRAEAFLTHGNLRITVVAEPSIFPATQTDLMLAGVDSKGPFLQEKLTPDPVKGTAEIRIEKARIPPGRILLKATAANRQTGRKHQVTKELLDPLKPAWLGTTAGVSDLVPAPWTPLQ
ncbi:MAG: hypothetical protein ACLQNE_08130, partial [Thermoguttaceae bacterium]